MSKAVSKIVLCVGGLVVLAGSTVALRQSGATPAPSAPAAPAVVSSPQDVPYAPSRFPGVQVRHVPDSTPAKAGAGASWIGKRRGTPSPRGGFQLPAVASRTRAGEARTGRGTTRFGGKWTEVPRDQLPLSVGRRTRAGKVAADCLADCLVHEQHK
jgi:hypothetical protein